MKKIASSELILNPDGRIYHLNLKPENISSTIITVGDPDRVEQVAKYFNELEFSTQKREFHTATGIYNGKRITVISSGIGVDNIDIVMNELDALVNIDLIKRVHKEQHTQLNLVRIGTSGTLQSDIPIDSFLVSEYGLGLDGMLHAYKCDQVLEREMEEVFIRHTGWNKRKARPYIVKASEYLESKIKSAQTLSGITATAIGFYGPQGRVLRLPITDTDLNQKMQNFEYNGSRVTNFEMETSALYGMAKLLGHNAVSINAIIANRALGTFSLQPRKTIDKLILYTLDRLTE